MADLHKSPAVHPFAEMRLDVPPVRYLANGIPVYVVDGGADGVNRLSVFVRGGTLDTLRPMQPTLTALSAIDGTVTRSRAQIAETLDYYGAWKSVQSYDEWVEIAFWSLNSNYQWSLDVLCDSLANPAFREQDFAVLRRRHAATCATSHRQPNYLAALEARRILYGDTHPLALDTTPEGINAFTSDHLSDFHRQYYNTANMCVVLSGQITDNIYRLTDSTLGSLDMPGAEAPRFDWEAHRQPYAACQRVVDCRDAVQSAIRIVIPAVPRQHPDYLKIRVLAHVLGGYFGSRLMRNIREDKGYTYGINAYLSGREYEGHIGISTECGTAHTWDVIDQVKMEMERLCNEAVPLDELELVRQYMLGDLAKTLDTPLSVGGYVSSIITMGMYPDYFNRQVETIKTVTPAELLEMAQRYLLEDRMSVAIAGDCNRLRT